MIADTDVRVWLDTQVNAGQTVVVPYVKSVKNMTLNFRMDLIQRGGSGISRISQQGNINAMAEQATALSRVAVGRSPNADCQIEILLREDSEEIGTYRFDCSH
jgi:hypothetical protein